MFPKFALAAGAAAGLSSGSTSLSLTHLPLAHQKGTQCFFYNPAQVGQEGSRRRRLFPLRAGASYSTGGSHGGDDALGSNESRPPAASMPLPRMMSWGLNGRSSPSARKAMGTSRNKDTTVHVCEVCGSEHVQWVGRCPTCKEWGSVKPFRVKREAGSKLSRVPRSTLAGMTQQQQQAGQLDGSGVAAGSGLGPSIGALADRFDRTWIPSNTEGYGVPTRLTDVTTEEATKRICIPGKELNRVLGGGLLPGTVVMMSGDPGIGKSTLIMQLAGHLSSPQNRQKCLEASVHVGPVIYISGEESNSQVAGRAQRLGIRSSELFILAETDIDIICEQLANMQPLPMMVVIDSIQTMQSSDLPSSAGSVTQVRECATKLVHLAKGLGIVVILVGHVTKSGDLAGPKVVEHMVDAVLYLEGDRLNPYRLLRAVKNRFGSSNEMGVFEMTSDGLEEVENPSALFMSTASSSQQGGAASTEVLPDGTAVMVCLEGTRPILCELQSLVTRSRLPSPRRTADGVPLSRLLLLLAVLDKRLNYYLQSHEVYVNVVGGLKVQETAADLAMAVAIVSSITGIPTKPDTCFIGEVGLGGELREVQQLDRRIAEAQKYGFKNVIVAKSKRVRAKRSSDPTGADSSSGGTGERGGRVTTCRTLRQAIEEGLISRPPSKMGGRQPSMSASSHASDDSVSTSSNGNRNGNSNFNYQYDFSRQKTSLRRGPDIAEDQDEGHAADDDSVLGSEGD